MTERTRCGKPTNARRGGRPCQMRLKRGRCLVHDVRPAGANAKHCREIARRGGHAAAPKSSARLKAQTGDKHPRWKGDQAQKHSGRHRAQRHFKAKQCDRCSAVPDDPKKLHRHHKDRDTLNNDPGNIEILCEDCHVAEHNGSYHWFAEAVAAQPEPEHILTVDDFASL